MSKTLVYLHGFNSSPQSAKAQLTISYMQEHFPEMACHVPQLPFSPVAAMDIAQQIVEQVESPVLIGSSMGGYYANYLAECYGCRAVLVNPAVRPYELLLDYLGPQTNDYTGETFTLGEAQMLELKKYDVATMQQPGHRLLMVQSDDETLDFRQATSYYSRSPAIIEQGGNHSFTGFEKWLPAIAAFLQI